MKKKQRLSTTFRIGNEHIKKVRDIAQAEKRTVRAVIERAIDASVVANK